MDAIVTDTDVAGHPDWAVKTVEESADGVERAAATPVTFADTPGRWRW